MDSPTTLTGEPVIISRPELPWERMVYLVNAAPAALVKNGRVFIAYSASATDQHYCIGLLTADEDSDLTRILSAGQFQMNAQTMIQRPSIKGLSSVFHHGIETEHHRIN